MALFKRKRAQKKRKRALLRGKRLKKIRAPASLRANFRGAKKCLRHACAPRKCEEGVAVQGGMLGPAPPV
jgi:hypothetical protein